MLVDRSYFLNLVCASISEKEFVQDLRNNAVKMLNLYEGPGSDLARRNLSDLTDSESC